MDLRSIINTEAGEASSSSAPKQATPVTPIQTGPPQQGFRDFSQPPHASPGKHSSQDYGPPLLQPGGPGPYASPTSYQSQGTYTRPPPPPPIQAPPQNELRSPAGSFTSQSPYRQTPTSGMSNPQYPFTQNHQTPQSPAQHHQFPPSYPSRDSFSQSNGPSHQPHQGRGSPAPQTPPIGIPGQTHPYLQHQRSQSTLSTSTPTSAQSQQHYFNQYPQDSPVSAGQFPSSQLPQHQRQQSQPGTPLGPPIRQASGGFTQPTSPYQQRGLPSGPFSQFQTSPAPPPPATIPRLPSTPSGYDSQRTSVSDQHRRSQSERERSLSVSPKTRLPSQPRGDISIMQEQTENAYNMSNMPAKRKIEDREIPIEEPRRINQPEVRTQVNGNNRIPSISSNSSPKQPPKKRTRCTEPPIWAQSVKGRKSVFGAANSRINTKVNGKQPAAQPQPAPQPFLKSETNGHRPVTPNGPIDDPAIMLGPWERSITNKKPQEQITKVVADWLFYNVVSRDDFGELASRGVEVEIEAKLGQLIDKETNHRYELPVQTECVLRETGRINFRSSMTESQHKSLNDFLNGKVQETHPSNPGAQSQRRVPIEYRHRRETDKFFELPSSYNSTLPPALKAQLNPRYPVKVRVSHDQKTGEVIAKIIKARIADLDIYSPLSPLDCRISINFEMRFDGDLADLKVVVPDHPMPDRNKDRLSYSQSHYQIDLTQVTQVLSTNGLNRTEKEHELEIEVSTAAIRDQGQRAMGGQLNEYVALVEGFLDNMRILARAVPPL